jgi:AcrR family transcriptional regulator
MMQHTLGKRERNKRARKESLYSVAIDLFRRQGFDETRVEEITQAAGVAKGTFFNYFPTKEDILLYITERHMSRLGATLNNGTGARLSREQSTIEAIKFLMHTLADSLEEDRDLVGLAVDKAMKIAHLAPATHKGRFSFQGLIAILVARGQRSGEIQPEIDPELVAQMLEGLYYQQLVLWCQQGFAFDLGERLDQVVDVLVTGIGTGLPRSSPAGYAGSRMRQ